MIREDSWELSERFIIGVDDEEIEACLRYRNLLNMSEKEVKEKLSIKLKSIPTTEEEVVYILSRIRKILEIKNYPSEFSILNFYCNLTLHAKISRPPKEIVDKLKKIKDATDDYSKELFDITRGDFHKQLDLFCKTYNIESFYSISNSKQILGLSNLLLRVWSHTPIRIEYTEAFDFVIAISKDGFLAVTSNPVR